MSSDMDPAKLGSFDGSTGSNMMRGGPADFSKNLRSSFFNDDLSNEPN